MAKSMVTMAQCLLCNSSPGRIVAEENIMAKPMVTMAPPKDKNDYSANWKKLQAVSCLNWFCLFVVYWSMIIRHNSNSSTSIFFSFLWLDILNEKDYTE